MRYRKLGKTGLSISTLVLGGNVFGWNLDQEQSFAVLDAYIAGGGNCIDTADSYARWKAGNVGGESETIIGEWLAARGQREQVLIATKVGGAMGDGPNLAGLSRHHIIQGAEASLRRLRTDYIDLFQAHWDDTTTTQNESLAAFDHLVKSGKVRYIGASNFSAWRMARALGISEWRGYARYAAIQTPYNLLRRDEFEREMQPLCLELGIGALAYGSLAGGFLTGKYRREGPIPPSVRAAGIQNRAMHERGFAIVDALERIAQSLNARPAQVAIAWLLAQPGMTAALASATSVAQVEVLLGAATLILSAAALAELDEVSGWRERK